MRHCPPSRRRSTSAPAGTDQGNRDVATERDESSIYCCGDGGECTGRSADPSRGRRGPARCRSARPPPSAALRPMTIAKASASFSMPCSAVRAHPYWIAAILAVIWLVARVACPAARLRHRAPRARPRPRLIERARLCSASCARSCCRPFSSWSWARSSGVSRRCATLRALHDPGRLPACRAGDDRLRVGRHRSARRSAARSPRWATASIVRLPARASSRSWFTTRCPCSSAPTTENELRIRSIVDDLATQREAIVNNADRVRSAIVVAHEDLSLALGSVAGRISSEVSEAGFQVMRAFGDRGGQLTTELGNSATRWSRRWPSVLDADRAHGDHGGRGQSRAHLVLRARDRQPDPEGRRDHGQADSDCRPHQRRLRDARDRDQRRSTSRATALNETLTLNSERIVTEIVERGTGGQRHSCPHRRLAHSGLRGRLRNWSPADPRTGTKMVEQIATSVAEVNHSRSQYRTRLSDRPAVPADGRHRQARRTATRTRRDSSPRGAATWPTVSLDRRAHPRDPGRRRGRHRAPALGDGAVRGQRHREPLRRCGGGRRARVPASQQRIRAGRGDPRGPPGDGRARCRLALSGSGDTLTRVVEEHSDAALAEINNGVLRLETVDAQTDTLAKSLAQRLELYGGGGLGNHHPSVPGRLEERLRDLKSQALRNTPMPSCPLKSTLTNFGSRFSSEAETVRDNLDQRLAQFEDRFSTLSASAHQTLDDRLAGFEDRFGVSKPDPRTARPAPRYLRAPLDRLGRRNLGARPRRASAPLRRASWAAPAPAGPRRAPRDARRARRGQHRGGPGSLRRPTRHLRESLPGRRDLGPCDARRPAAGLRERARAACRRGDAGDRQPYQVSRRHRRRNHGRIRPNRIGQDARALGEEPVASRLQEVEGAIKVDGPSPCSAASRTRSRPQPACSTIASAASTSASATPPRTWRASSR